MFNVAEATRRGMTYIAIPTLFHIKAGVCTICFGQLHRDWCPREGYKALVNLDDDAPWALPPSDVFLVEEYQTS